VFITIRFARGVMSGVMCLLFEEGETSLVLGPGVGVLM